MYLIHFLDWNLIFHRKEIFFPIWSSCVFFLRRKIFAYEQQVKHVFSMFSLPRAFTPMSQLLGKRCGVLGSPSKNNSAQLYTSNRNWVPFCYVKLKSAVVTFYSLRDRHVFAMFFHPSFFFGWVGWDLPAFGTYRLYFPLASTECSQNIQSWKWHVCGGKHTTRMMGLVMKFTSQNPLFECIESICYIRLVVAETLFLFKVCLEHTEMNMFFSKVFCWKKN